LVSLIANALAVFGAVKDCSISIVPVVAKTDKEGTMDIVSRRININERILLYENVIVIAGTFFFALQ
jgi:hypothetical protein